MKYGQGKIVRLYYTTPQVCEFLEVEPKFLVQLEKEFPEIRVDKNKAGKKIYRHKYFILLKLAIAQLKHGIEQNQIHEILAQVPKNGIDEWVERHLENLGSEVSLPLDALPHSPSHDSFTITKIRTELSNILQILCGSQKS